MCIYAVYSDLYTIFVPYMIYLLVLYNISFNSLPSAFVYHTYILYIYYMYRESDPHYDSGGCGRDRLLRHHQRRYQV